MAAMTDPPTLVICRGLPGSGKTTYAESAVTSSPRGTVARVNRDELRRRVFAREYLPDDGEFEDVVTNLQHTMIRTLLGVGVSVVCDDTNLYQEHTAALMRLAYAAGRAMADRGFHSHPVRDVHSSGPDPAAVVAVPGIRRITGDPRHAR